MRKRIPSNIRRQVFKNNLGVCCVCKRRNIGINFHHIDEDTSNNDAANIAILCVEEHDQYHRPHSYSRSHIELNKDQISLLKQEWEYTVRETRKKTPKLVATINLYGSLKTIHSGRLIVQNHIGKIVHEKLFNQLTGTPDTWTDEIIDEILWLSKNITLVISKPLKVKHSGNKAFQDPLPQKRITDIICKRGIE